MGELAEPSQDSEAQAPAAAESADPADRKRDCVLELWPFSQPSETYSELYQILGKAEEANVGILMSATAHPAAWVAMRRLRLSVFFHTERFSEHALGHGMEIARHLRQHDLKPISADSGRSVATSGFEIIKGPIH